MQRAIPVPLPRLLSLLPRNGLGASVYESRWAGKGLPVPTTAAPSSNETCRWDVKKVKLHTDNGKIRARAYGVLHWKGKRITPQDKEYEPIRGGYKYLWQSAVPPQVLIERAQAAAKSREAAPSPAEEAEA
ncbi:phenylalanine ammonia lyase [Rhodotorula diobovata]|uniref:Phenylalanine ammonia lyase n=1 Tax=Rhodotorula diobovata TaxID=5288 RepID=A0A5C5FW65_9BASI|nr:phenylalanine ammonia lyase [Rhodotorula diobovata]